MDEPEVVAAGLPDLSRWTLAELLTSDDPNLRSALDDLVNLLVYGDEPDWAC
jgi:hypothetical protein